VQKAIAESYAEYRAGRTYVYNVARKLDLSTFGNGLDGDGVKLFCAPVAKRIADRAIQVSVIKYCNTTIILDVNVCVYTGIIIVIVITGSWRKWIHC
jgi:hypothetical protein